MASGWLLRCTLALASSALLGGGCASLVSDGSGDPDKADGLDGCVEIEHKITFSLDMGQRAFAQPVATLPHPSDPGRWYVVEQRGIIWTTVRAEGTVVPRRFVDLRDLVHDEADEAGLFSMALHPDFEQNGKVYLSYTATSSDSPVNLESRVSEFVSNDGGLKLDPTSERVLMRVPQPFLNHNGGQIAFGPDGLLYIGFGDGGSAGDPLGAGQATTTPLGKILRIDVDGAVDGGRAYGIPDDNPFADGVDGLAEIYATGIRNPWRFSFDSESGELWLGDVGQNSQEEVNIVTKGGNYGWNLREGDGCFNAAVCEDVFVNPVATYGRDEGISISGGFVYRGTEIPDLVGSYLFGDFGSGKIWRLLQSPVTGEFERELLAETSMNISAFGQDTDGELFVVDYGSGQIFKVGPGETEEICPPSGAAPESFDQPPISFDTFDEIYDNLISVKCAPCHTQRGLGGLAMPNADEAFDALVNIEAETPDCANRTRVIPGQPDDSVLFSKLSGVNLCGPEMPPTGALSGEEIEAVRKWIVEGAAR